MVLPLATAWWAPLAIVGGALGGAVFGYLLLVVAGSTRPREASESRRLRFQTTEKTSYPQWNPAAFLAAAALVGLIVGLAVGLSVG
ncbi:MAG TPA: hypothetical protein VHF22_00085 [Planctomycetota bacterium]|jgi:hypothetical protein|nr:hypothetical protein [Planctomycetota bacterium]